MNINQVCEVVKSFIREWKVVDKDLNNARIEMSQDIMLPPDYLFGIRVYQVPGKNVLRMVEHVPVSQVEPLYVSPLYHGSYY